MRQTDIHNIHADCIELHTFMGETDIPAVDAIGLSAVGYGLERTEYEIRRWRRQDHQVLITTGGEGWIQLEQQRHKAVAGTVLFCRDGSFQHYGILGTHWEIIWFRISPDNEFWNHIIGNRSSGIFSYQGALPLRDALKGLHREMQSDLPGREELCGTYAKQISLYIQRLLRPTQPQTLEMEQKAKLLTVLEHVDENLSTAWSVPELARVSGLHVCPDHFAKLCRGLLGKPPLQLVTELRMRKAAELLKCTDYRLELLADMLGYKSAFALSAAFKRYHGCSPKHYRQT